MEETPVSKEKFAEIMKQPELKAVEQPEQSMGAVEAVRAIAPGLSLSKILSDVGQELKEQGKHGSHELAAALFNGSPFVMYPRTGKDSVEGSEAKEQTHVERLE